MSFPRYPSYKPSGVEWLGEVPEHWEVKRFKHVFKEREERSASGEELLLSVSAYTGVSPRAEVIDEGDHLSRAESLEGYKLCYKDDLVVNIMLAWNRGLAFTTHQGIVSPAYCVYFVIDGSDPGFLNYLVRSDEYTLYFKAFSSGVIESRLRIYPDTFGRLFCGIPPLAEQTAIAAFLDRETGKIDALVAEQRRLMELLKEKRQAVISHAVTQGLNPQAPMKDSGIEWLGKVPKHWEVKPLKYLISLTSGGTPSKENLAYWNGTVPWASSKDLKTAELFDTQDHITQKALDDGAADLVPSGSILTVVRGMILLHTFPVVVARVSMAINQDLKAILPTAGVNADFLAWLLRGASSEVLSRTDEAGHGTKVLRLESWLAMQVPVPPPDEQTLIVIAITKRLAELDTLTAEAQRAIDLLQERRTALISAAVTGQIDVRA